MTTGSSFSVSGHLNPDLWQIRHIPNMKHKPQTLTPPAATLVVAVFAAAVLTPVPLTLADEKSAVQQDSAAQSETGNLVARPKLKLKRSALTSAEVFEKMLTKLEQNVPLTCNLKQVVTISGRRIEAVGRYAEQTGNRMRLEYRISPFRGLGPDDEGPGELDEDVEQLPEKDEEKGRGANVSSTLLHVCDGSVYWSYWVNGKTKQLRQRNVTEILEAAEKQPQLDQPLVLRNLGIGGIKSLIAQLKLGMEFGAVLENPVGNRGYLVLTGRWNKVMRDEFEKNPAVRAVVPDFLRIYVDEATLLPRRIQYLRGVETDDKVYVAPMSTLDLQITPNATVPDEMFVFKRPDDASLQDLDETEFFIQVLSGGAGNAPAAESQGGAQGN